MAESYKNNKPITPLADWITTTNWIVDSLFEWVPEERNIYNYQSGEFASLVSQAWEEDTWINNTRTVFSQVETGSAVINYYWNEFDWELSDSTFSYDMDGLSLFEETFEWVDSMQSYIPLSLTELEYDSQWNVTKRTRSEYDTTPRLLFGRAPEIHLPMMKTTSRSCLDLMFGYELIQPGNPPFKSSGWLMKMG